MKQVKINYNGKLVDANTPIITAENRSFRYGDGFFETMRWHQNKIVLANYHFERLFATLELLGFEKPKHFTVAFLQNEIEELLIKNNHLQNARIRLNIFRGDGGLYDAENHHPNYIIETWALPNYFQFNENGLIIDVYKDAKKTCDNFSHLKTNNFLAYTMAALWAKKQQLNDAVVLNSNSNVADTTIANIWIVKDGIIKTPAIIEGCIAGVMRKYLLHCLQKENYPVVETTISVEDVLQANEVFLTNAIKGIAWVKQCGKSEYQTQLAPFLFNQFIQTL